MSYKRQRCFIEQKSVSIRRIRLIRVPVFAFLPVLTKNKAAGCGAPQLSICTVLSSKDFLLTLVAIFHGFLHRLCIKLSGINRRSTTAAYLSQYVLHRFFSQQF